MKRERNGRDLGDFLEREVYPALFSHLDRAFPEFGWKNKGRKWTATTEDTRALSGAPRAARVEAFENTPFGFKVHGGEFISWVSYLTGGVTPRGKEFVEVARDLAERAGIPFPEWNVSPEVIEKHKATERRLSLLECFLAYTHGQLLGDAGRGARDYLAGRGFTAEDLEETELGFYLSGNAVKVALVAAGFSSEEVDASGMLKDGRWEGRLVRPLRGPDGRIASYLARDLTGKAEDGAKYLYLVGHSKPSFVGLDTALRSLDGRHLLLVEGVLDLDLLWARGITNVAALGGSGSLLTVERWKTLLEARVRSVTLVLDNDAPGKDGLFRSLENVLKVPHAPVVYVVDPTSLGDSKDPDEFVRKNGADAFREILKEKIPGFVFYGRGLLSGVSTESTEHEKREAVDAVLEFTSGLHGDFVPRDREELLRVTAEATGFSFESLAEMEDERLSRRHMVELDETVDATLLKAQADRERGVSSIEVANSFGRSLDAIRGKLVSPPPPFSVDRLLVESRKTVAGRKSGWEPLDKLGVEFCPGELTILGARTGHGKTSVLVNLLLNWLEEDRDETFLFYSLEEPEVRICHQLLALLTTRGHSQDSRWTAPEIRDFLRAGYSSRYEHYRWPYGGLDGPGEAIELLRSFEDRLRIVYRPEWTISEIASHARDVAERETVGAVFVDYLQRIQPPARGEGLARYDRRDMEISAIGRTLKKVSVDINVPVLVGAQINREAVPSDLQSSIKNKTFNEAIDTIKKARPELHHLREGGSEQEADIVLGLLNYAADYRSDHTREAPPDTTPFEVGVLKARYGEVGRWAALFFTGKFKLIQGVR